MTRSGAVQIASVPAEGAAIVNARGIPGTIGFAAITLDESRVVLVTTHHALFGGDAPARAPVWVQRAGISGAERDRIGVSGWSRRGIVRFGGAAVYVDCGAVALDPRFRPAGDELEDATALPREGARVTKIGAGSGRTDGIIVDAGYAAEARIDGRPTPALRQILIRSSAPGHRFSVSGDSGAAVRDGTGALVGVLWGVTPQGDALACPIAPVLWLLHVRPLRPPSLDSSSRSSVV